MCLTKRIAYVFTKSYWCWWSCFFFFQCMNFRNSIGMVGLAFRKETTAINKLISFYWSISEFLMHGHTCILFSSSRTGGDLPVNIPICQEYSSLKSKTSIGHKHLITFEGFSVQLLGSDCNKLLAVIRFLCSSVFCDLQILSDTSEVFAQNQ